MFYIEDHYVSVRTAHQPDVMLSTPQTLEKTKGAINNGQPREFGK